MDKPHLTAITRRGPSVPIKWLDSHSLLTGRILDFGCGKGMDAESFDMDRYDPFYSPEYPTGKYDTITCTYVLNVVDENTADTILAEILALLSKVGIAYLTVRRDIKKEGLTSRGTFQRNVRHVLPIMTENSRFCIYKLQRIVST